MRRLLDRSRKQDSAPGFAREYAHFDCQSQAVSATVRKPKKEKKGDRRNVLVGQTCAGLCYGSVLALRSFFAFAAAPEVNRLPVFNFQFLSSYLSAVSLRTSAPNAH